MQVTPDKATMRTVQREFVTIGTENVLVQKVQDSEPDSTQPIVHIRFQRRVQQASCSPRDALHVLQRELRAAPTSSAIHVHHSSGRRGDAPVRGLDGYLLLDELAALFEDEVAPLRLATFARPECGDEHTLRVREQRIRELFL